MLRAASETRLRCTDHPHRRATRQCARCKLGYCDECAARFGDSTICDRCQQELAEKHRIEHPPVEERVRRFGVSLRNALILLAVLGLLAIPMSRLVQQMVETPISCEEFARFRYAAGGTFEGPEGVNVISTVLGAKIVAESAAEPEHTGRRLIDECVNPGVPAFRAPTASLPAVAVVETSQVTRVEKLLFQQHPEEPRETWAREVEVRVSSQGPDGPFESIGRFTLGQTEEPQRFVLDAPRDFQWIELRILSSYGGPYTSLGEFNAYILPRGPLGQGTPQLTPPAKP